jgi:selT/selW/selH-like putative selenoprotein
VEAELKANYFDSNIKLVSGSNGIFEIKYNGRLIYSKKNIEGQRFPDDGEITKLIKQEMG